MASSSPNSPPPQYSYKIKANNTCSFIDPKLVPLLFLWGFAIFIIYVSTPPGAFPLAVLVVPALLAWLAWSYRKYRVDSGKE